MKYQPPKRSCLGIIKVVQKNKNNFYFLLNTCHHINISENILFTDFVNFLYFYIFGHKCFNFETFGKKTWFFLENLNCRFYSLFKLTYFYDSEKYNKEIEKENFKSVDFGSKKWHICLIMSIKQIFLKNPKQSFLSAHIWYYQVWYEKNLRNNSRKKVRRNEEK